MNIKLTIPERLKDLRSEKGVNQGAVAAAAEVSSSAVSGYENIEDKDISHRAIIALAKYYGVTADYLLGLTEIKNRPNAELHELHLDDKTIDLLKSGRINNRLLCEMANHKTFTRLMADIVIYIDRLIEMPFQTLDAIMDASRNTLIQEIHPDKDDVYLRTLELAQGQEEKYILQVIHDDLDEIIQELRERHKSDRTTADEENHPATEKVIQHLQDAVKVLADGKKDEATVRVLCQVLEIPYDDMTEDEFIGVIKWLNRSSFLMKTAVSLRGKALKQSCRTRKGKK